QDVWTIGSALGLTSRGWEKRQRKIVFVYFGLNPISSLDFFSLYRGFVGPQTHFFSVQPLDEIDFTLYAHDVALDDVDPLHVQGRSLSIGLSIFPSGLAHCHVVRSRYHIDHSKTQQKTI